MSKKDFTEKEVRILSQSKCVNSVTTKKIIYTNEFKRLLIAAHDIGGIPQEILFDSMRTVVDRSKSTFSSIEFNKTFKHFADDAGFNPIACRPYRPETKGYV